MATRWRAALYYLILWLTPIVGSLGTGEIVVRLLAPQDLSGTWLTYGPRGLVINKSSTTARHQQGDSVVYYRFNHLHQRGAELQPGARPVLVLGDSFTFGWMLEEPVSYVGRLQARVDERFGAGRFQLLNAATAGWGAGDYLAYLEAFGEQVRPYLVLVFVNFDDLDRALRTPLYSLGADGRAVARDLSGERSLLKMMMDRIPLYDWLLEHSHVVQLLRNSTVRGVRASVRDIPSAPPSGLVPALPSSTAPDVDNRIPLAKALMGRLKDWCDSRNIPQLVLTTGWVEADGRSWMGEVSQAFGAAFVDLAFDVATVVRKEPALYQLASDGHPNARGAGVVAEAAWSALEKALSDGAR